MQSSVDVNEIDFRLLEKGLDCLLGHAKNVARTYERIHGDNLDMVDFNRTFKTVAISMPRRSGLTEYIIRHSASDAIIVLPSGSFRGAYSHNPSALAKCRTLGGLREEFKMRPLIASEIWVEHPSLTFKDGPDRERFYRLVSHRNVDQFFYLMGE